MKSGTYNRLKKIIFKHKDHNIIKCVYMIRSVISDKIYIGSTNDMFKRWEFHKLDLKSNRHHNSRLQEDFNIHGINNFSVEILWSTTGIIDRNELYLIEQIFIDKFDPEYNIKLKVDYIIEREPAGNIVINALPGDSREAQRRHTKISSRKTRRSV